MAQVKMRVQYLGHKVGEFKDQESGLPVSYGSLFVWDAESVDAPRVKTSSEYTPRQLENAVEGLKFGDVIDVLAEISVAFGGKSVQYKLRGIEKVSAKAVPA